MKVPKISKKIKNINTMVTNLNYVQEEIKTKLNVGTFDPNLLLFGLLSQHLNDILPLISMGVKLGLSLKRATEKFEDNSTVRRIFRTQNRVHNRRPNKISETS